MIVRRLKNSPKGEPYGVETKEAKDQDQAEELLQTWWASRGTLAAVILHENGNTESHYVREWIDEERIPGGWMKYWKPPPKVPQPQREPNPEPENPAPIDLFVDGPEPKPEPPEDTRVKCGCCGGTKRPREGDDDTSPSGRLNARRCMHCGRPLRKLTSRLIYRMYLDFVSRSG